MRFCLSWLKDHLNTQTSVDDIVCALINLGIEVEDVIDQGAAYRGFKLAQITRVEKHPHADRLNCCWVNTGEEEVQVVCGGSNVRPDMFVAFAPPGVVIPATGQILKTGIVRGIESNGMLCSLDELLLGKSQNHEIIDIQTDLPTGTSLDKVFKLDDVVIDVSITPNRGDCFSIHGIARDLATVLDKNLSSSM